MSAPLLLLYLPAAATMAQWSANMDYLTDGDSFTDIASHPPSTSHGDDSSYFDMAGSGMTERPNYYDPHLVDTRRSSLSQDALSNQLTTSYPTTVSGASPSQILIYGSAPMLLVNGGVVLTRYSDEFLLTLPSRHRNLPGVLVFLVSAE